MDFYSILVNKNLGGGVNNFILAVNRDLTKVTEKMIDGITKIRGHAFTFCSSLTSIEIPNSVIWIENNAFSDCSSLANITIPSSVTTMGEKVFQNCSSLKSVTVLPTTPPTLRSNAFTNTHSSLKIYVPSASVNAYKTADGWKDYASKIQAIPS